MKKPYQKPALLKEQFFPEGVLAACSEINTNPSVPEECNYKLDIVDIKIFASEWLSCVEEGSVYGYCYFGPTVNMFSS